MKTEDQLKIGKVAVKFWAKWCGPCKLVEPHIEKMKEEFPDIEYVSINTDDEPVIANSYNIKNIPAVLLLKDGTEIDRIVGAAKISAVRTAFRNFVEEN